MISSHYIYTKHLFTLHNYIDVIGTRYAISYRLSLYKAVIFYASAS